MPHTGSHPISIQSVSQVHYQLDVDGEIEKVLEEDTNSSTNFAEEHNDDIIQTDTGQRVEGVTGSTDPTNSTYWGDLYYAHGPITGITITDGDESQVRYYLDGTEMDPSQIAAEWNPGWNVLELVGVGESFNYDFTANGTARRYQTAPYIAANAKTDSVNQMANQTVVSGSAGGTGRGDAYLVEGDVTDYSYSGNHTIRWNGTEVTPAELTGTDSEPDDPCEGVVCGDGMTCENGECVPDDDNGGTDPNDPEDGNGGIDMQTAGVLIGGAALGLAMTQEDDE